MKMPDFYITEILKYNSPKELIEDLYLQALINAYPKVIRIKGIREFNENNIRDKFFDFCGHIVRCIAIK